MARARLRLALNARAIDRLSRIDRGWGLRRSLHPTPPPGLALSYLPACISDVVDPRRTLGALGEERAARWYAANGYSIVDRNWRCREGELDIVARRGGTLVFVEVKCRRTARFGIPAEAVTHTKQQRLRRLAARYLRVSGARAGALRFDVVSILAGEMEVIEAAF